MEESELDDLAVKIENETDRFIGDQKASRNFVLIDFATDESTGAYPQAKRTKDDFEDDGGTYRDRFPVARRLPITLKIARSAKWTNVLSSDLWSEGYLTDQTALEVFNQFDLGQSKQYPAEVARGQEIRHYTYLFTANHIKLEDIDFSQSEFYVADMLGSPKHLIRITSAEEFQTKRIQASRGELVGNAKFSRVSWKKMQLKPTQIPKAAVFGLGTFGTEMYVRRELYEALRNAQVSGLEFKRNNKLFDF